MTLPDPTANHTFTPAAPPADLPPSESPPPIEPPVVEEWDEPPPPPPPPGPPHPAFGWSLLWCFAYLMLSQVVPAVVVVVVLVAVMMVQERAEGEAPVGPDLMAGKLGDEYLVPVLLASQVIGAALSVVCLRLIAGRDWWRQVAWRLPTASHTLLAVALYPALLFLASGAYLIFKNVLPGFESLPAITLAFFAVLGVSTALVFALFGRSGATGLRRLPAGQQLAYVLPSAAMVLLMATVAYFYAVLLAPTLPPLGTKGFMEEMVQQFRSWPWALAVLLVGVGPAFNEELWCRAFLGRGLVGSYGVVLGILLTSFLFGLIHVDPHQGSMAILMGVVLHYAYVTTRSLWIPILLHFLNNATSVVAHRLDPMLEKIDADPEHLPVSLFAAAGVLFLVTAWALYRTRARLEVEPDTGPADWEQPWPGVILPPEQSNVRVRFPPLDLVSAVLVALALVGLGTAYALEREQALAKAPAAQAE